MLCSQDYPDERYEVWVIDDNSTDKTPSVVGTTKQEYDQVKVLRLPGQVGVSRGTESGVAADAGEILAVFDADAQVSKPPKAGAARCLNGARWGGATIANEENFWTQGQVAEMAVDIYPAAAGCPWWH